MNKDDFDRAINGGKNLECANLRYADLSGADLRDANLSGADLVGANLSGANLRYANLSGANLMCANLSGADLVGANLSGANLMCANLMCADLSGAYLEGADLKYANLVDVNLKGANLRGAHLYRIVGKKIYTFQGNRHFACCCDGMIQIGCHSHTISEWLEVYDKVGKDADYTEEDISVYKAFIDLCKNQEDTYGL